MAFIKLRDRNNGFFILNTAHITLAFSTTTDSLTVKLTNGSEVRVPHTVDEFLTLLDPAGLNVAPLVWKKDEDGADIARPLPNILPSLSLRISVQYGGTFRVAFDVPEAGTKIVSPTFDSVGKAKQYAAQFWAECLRTDVFHPIQ